MSRSGGIAPILAELRPDRASLLVKQDHQRTLRLPAVARCGEPVPNGLNRVLQDQLCHALAHPGLHGEDQDRLLAELELSGCRFLFLELGDGAAHELSLRTRSAVEAGGEPFAATDPPTQVRTPPRLRPQALQRAVRQLREAVVQREHRILVGATHDRIVVVELHARREQVEQPHLFQAFDGLELLGEPSSADGVRELTWQRILQQRRNHTGSIETEFRLVKQRRGRACGCERG